MKVIVGASSFDESGARLSDLFTERGIEIRKNPYGRKMTKDEIIKELQGTDGILAGLEPLDEEVFVACPELKAIARIGIGMDNVDLEAAKKHAVKVSNTPNGPTEAVAEMTVTALLSICHNLVSLNNAVHNGVWKKSLGRSVSELTVLLVGYGNIGKKTGAFLKMLGANVLIYDKYLPDESNCELEGGLAQADVISLHAAGKEEIITADMFEKVKDGVIILNSARGGLINEKALYDALKSNKVSAFWGDALWQEPYTGKMVECENAILTPHISTYTKKCRESMERQAVLNLLRDLGY